MPGLPCKPATLYFSSRIKLTLFPIASVDLDQCIETLYKKNLLAESVIEAICAKTKELLMQESNVVHVQAPVTVVGDIHGQFFDLIEIFKIGGFCPDTNYLFLGTWTRLTRS
jgi:serine/threonine-protein phosphatase PPG1